MTRRHRLWHLSLWLLIGPLLIAGFAAGIALRPRMDNVAAGTPSQEARP